MSKFNVKEMTREIKNLISSARSTKKVFNDCKRKILFIEDSLNSIELNSNIVGIFDKRVKTLSNYFDIE